MTGERNYYELLGVEPTADAAAIDAAYQGRALRFRVGSFGERQRQAVGPTREEIERAYAVLRDPAARARYDAEFFPVAVPVPVKPRSRGRSALWFVLVFLLVAIVLVAFARFPARQQPAGDPIERALASDPGGRATLTAWAAPTSIPLTAPATRTPTSTVPPATPIPTALAALPPAPAPTLAPTATATLVPPTATRPAPTAPPPPSTPTPPPAPTPVPFPATDRIGTVIPVNFRAGPGTNFASLGALPQGTLLAATGEEQLVNGFLWRRFRLANGATGWVRDIDVLPVR